MILTISNNYISRKLQCANEASKRAYKTFVVSLTRFMAFNLANLIYSFSCYCHKTPSNQPDSKSGYMSLSKSSVFMWVESHLYHSQNSNQIRKIVLDLKNCFLQTKRQCTDSSWHAINQIKKWLLDFVQCFKIHFTLLLLCVFFITWCI